ncbi:MAG: PHB depolymerase family esterase [Chitinophagaceae bacterium]
MRTLAGKLIALLLVITVMGSCQKDDRPEPSVTNDSIVETVPPYLRGLTLNINQYIGGYYESIPNHYLVTTKKYPLIIFLHGAGQEGDGGKDLPLLLNDGVVKLIKEQRFPSNFKVNGNDFSFVVLSPQMRAMPTDTMIASFLNFALAHYRIDAQRIYICGLSMGAVVTTQVAGKYTPSFAAGVSVSGATFGPDKATYAAGVAAGGFALWSFHNSGDPVTPASTTTDFVNLVNSKSPLVPARSTIFQSAVHDAWTKAFDPAYKENNMNVYEWMLQYKR